MTFYGCLSYTTVLVNGWPFEFFPFTTCVIVRPSGGNRDGAWSLRRLAVNDEVDVLGPGIDRLHRDHSNRLGTDSRLRIRLAVTSVDEIGTRAAFRDGDICRHEDGAAATILVSSRETLGCSTGLVFRLLGTQLPDPEERILRGGDSARRRWSGCSWGGRFRGPRRILSGGGQAGESSNVASKSINARRELRHQSPAIARSGPAPLPTEARPWPKVGSVRRVPSWGRSRTAL